MQKYLEKKFWQREDKRLEVYIPNYRMIYGRSC